MKMGQRRRLCCASTTAADDHAHTRRMLVPRSSTVRSCCRWQTMQLVVVTMMMTFISLALQMSAVSSFHFVLMPNYKPPVKHSVSKIRNSRGGDRHHPSVPETRPSTSTSKSAYAGTMSLSPPPAAPQQKTFEERMRDLVLGETLTQTQKSTAGPTTVQKPANCVTVKDLREYKRVVADEDEKIVAVRFHSPWCRVRYAARIVYRQRMAGLLASL